MLKNHLSSKVSQKKIERETKWEEAENNNLIPRQHVVTHNEYACRLLLPKQISSSLLLFLLLLFRG
jgi:hypothetical protein